MKNLIALLTVLLVAISSFSQTISAVSPNTGTQGTASLPITISGSGTTFNNGTFTNASNIRFRQGTEMLTVNSVNSISSTAVNVSIQISNTNSLGNYDVDVYDYGLGNYITLQNGFTVLQNNASQQCQDSIFVNGHTIDAGISGVSYQWFRDCSIPSMMQPIAGATNQTYTPSSYGWDYSVVVTSGSCVDTSTCVFIDTNCMAYFRATQTTPGQVILIDSSYGASAALSFTWNFGDGSIANTRYPSHTYAAAGTYQVTLYIYDTLSGCSNFYHDTITVDTSGILRAGFSVSVIKAEPVSIEDRNELENITMYPNPATSSVNLNFGKVYDKLLVNIFDVSGKVMFTNTVSNQGNSIINTSNFVSGIYMVQLISGNSNSMLKLIIE